MLKSTSLIKEIGAKQKIAFVCSGGATKAGAFHLGVALALQEQGFKFMGGLLPQGVQPASPGPMEISTYVGSSAGSIISTLLAAGYSLDNIFNSFLNREPSSPLEAKPKRLPKLTYQKMFKIRPELATEQIKQFLLIRKIFSSLVEGDFGSLLQIKWLKATGLFSTSGIEQYLREEVLLSNRFQDYAADLFVVATQLNHSRKVVFGKYHYQPPPHDLTCQYNSHAPVSEACAASTALPFIYAPYPITGEDGKPQHYIDGEIRDTLSTHVAVDAGADLIFASYTHQPYHFVPEVGSLTEHGLTPILLQSIYLLIEQKINNYIHFKQKERDAIEAVSQYCKSSGVSEKLRHKLCEILEEKLHHRMEVDMIYIHPKPDDAKLFLKEHFSLSPNKMAEIVKCGFKAAIDVLRKYRFTEKKEGPSIVGQAGQG